MDRYTPYVTKPPLFSIYHQRKAGWMPLTTGLGDRHRSGTPEDGAIARAQITQVLVRVLSLDKALDIDNMSRSGETECSISELTGVQESYPI